jgi:hypothetical protein
VFIGISQSVLRNSVSVDDLAKLSLQQMFKNSGSVHDSAAASALVKEIVLDIPAKDNGSVNYAAAEGLMLLLARETGFVVEHELALAQQSSAGLQCKIGGISTTFYGQSWKGYDKPTPEEGYIHVIGMKSWNSGVTPKRPPPTAQQIATEAQQGGSPPTNAIRDMTTIYGPSTSTPKDTKLTPEWVDIVATQAPIEDFVETYVLDAMSNAKDPKNPGSLLMKNFYVVFQDKTSSRDLIAYPPADISPLGIKMQCLNDPKNGLIVQLQQLQPLP